MFLYFYKLPLPLYPPPKPEASPSFVLWWIIRDTEVFHIRVRFKIFRIVTVAVIWTLNPGLILVVFVVVHVFVLNFKEDTLDCVHVSPTQIQLRKIVVVEETA